MRQTRACLGKESDLGQPKFRSSSGSATASQESHLAIVLYLRTKPWQVIVQKKFESIGLEFEEAGNLPHNSCIAR